MLIWDSLVAQMLKNVPAMQETWAQSLRREGPLEKGMTTHAGILAWRIPWTEDTWRATVHGVVKSWTRMSDFTFTFILEFLRRILKTGGEAQISK